MSDARPVSASPVYSKLVPGVVRVASGLFPISDILQVVIILLPSSNQGFRYPSSLV